jgi:hypothetical protein
MDLNRGSVFGTTVSLATMPDNYRLMVQAVSGDEVAARMLGLWMLLGFDTACRSRVDQPDALIEHLLLVTLAPVEAAVVS